MFGFVAHPLGTAGDPSTSGIHASTGSIPLPVKPSGATPTTVNGSPPSWMGRPSTDASPAKWRVQSAWLITTARTLAAPVLALVKNRPADGLGPSNRKYEGVTARTLASSASSPAVNVSARSAYAVTSEKTLASVASS